MGRPPAGQLSRGRVAQAGDSVTALSVRSLERSYGHDVLAVRDVSFTIEDGHTAALLGPSGCGKSTVLRLIAGLDAVDAGDVLLDGRSVLREAPERRGIGLMFQELALFPHLDVRGNVAFGLRMAKWSRSDRESRVEEMLELVALTELAARRIDELSGGERQRVALARTLAPGPDVLLLDEPLGALDEELKRSLRTDLRELLRAVDATALIVSHDLRDAVAMADDLIVMHAGTILQSGPLPDVLGHPRTAEVAAMVGYVTLAEGEVVNGAIVEPGVGGVVAAELADSTARARAMAHPSALLVVPAGRGLGCGVSGTVRAARPDGPQQRVDVALGQRAVEARWEWDLDPPATGATVELAVRPGTLRCYALDVHAPAPAAGAGRDGGPVDGVPLDDEPFDGEQAPGHGDGPRNRWPPSRA